MNFYPNVKGQDLIILQKLGEQQRSQRAIKNKNKFSKQTNDKILAENLKPITQKLDEVDKSTTKNRRSIYKTRLQGRKRSNTYFTKCTRYSIFT